MPGRIDFFLHEEWGSKEKKEKKDLRSIEPRKKVLHYKKIKKGEGMGLKPQLKIMQ